MERIWVEMRGEMRRGERSFESLAVCQHLEVNEELSQYVEKNNTEK